MPQFADVRVSSVVDATLYRITISGSNHDFTSGAGTTTTLIRDGLIAAVNAGPQPVRAYAYTADRLLIVPTNRTNTRTYAVNSAVLLGLTVGYDTVDNPVPNLVATTGPATIYPVLTVWPTVFADYEVEYPLPPFRILLVTPIGSNRLRVFFSSEPRHFSPLSVDDALNRLNYAMSIVSGPGTIPVIEGVENPSPRPETFPSEPGAWSVDLITNQRVLAATTYLTIASSVMFSAVGQPMAPPPYDRDDHPGDMTPRPRRPEPPTATAGGLDYRYDTISGRILLDARNDFAVHGGREFLVKLIVRRIISRPGGFFHLPKYGVGLRVKELMTTTNLNQIQAAIERQVILEPEVKAVSASVAKPAPGVLVVALRVQTRNVKDLGITLKIDDTGNLVVL